MSILLKEEEKNFNSHIRISFLKKRKQRNKEKQIGTHE